MPQQTPRRFYPTYAAAAQAVASLAAHGVPASDISLIESVTDARLPRDAASDSALPPARLGATLGAAIGGGIGLLDGLGSITLPGVPSFAAWGWFVPALLFAGLGACGGAAVGSVTGVGVRDKESHWLAQGFRRGGHLVMARVDAAAAPQVEAILAGPLETPVPEPLFASEPATATSPASEIASIYRRERAIDYKSE